MVTINFLTLSEKTLFFLIFFVAACLCFRKRFVLSTVAYFINSLLGTNVVNLLYRNINGLPSSLTRSHSLIAHCELVYSQSLALLPPADVSPRASVKSDWLDRDKIYSAPQLILSSHGWVSKKNWERAIEGDWVRMR